MAYNHDQETIALKKRMIRFQRKTLSLIQYLLQSNLSHIIVPQQGFNIIIISINN